MIDYRDTLTFEKGRPVLVMRNLAKSYQLGTVELQVLRDINLTITSGEYVAIMGPSGSGKSTLLNLIGCLDRPTGGEYLLGGQNVSTLDDNQLSTIRGAYVGFVFQSFKLIAQLNIIENIEIPMYYQGYSEQESAARAMELAQMVGLGERTRHRPSELSGGQQQRVAIARALASDPEVLLCDEATSALDPMTTQAILRLLQKINREMGITIVVITHEMAVIRQICTHVAILDGGVIAEEGSVDDVFTHTRSEAGKRLFGIVASENHEQVQEKPAIRIVFNGETIAEPIVADLILHLGVPLSIRSADVHTLNGAQYGQLLISRPDDPMVCHRAIEYLKERGLTVEEVRA